MIVKNDTDWKPGNFADEDGHFRRPESVFRSFISADPNSQFPAEARRYVLYFHYACPWAHRTLITRILKGLEDVIDVVELDTADEIGWAFGGKTGPAKDPRYGFTHLRQLYLKAVPDWDGRSSIPMLWDTKKETIVNNNSSEILQMLYTDFDAFIPDARREATKGEAGIIPSHLKTELDTMREWVYHSIGDGVYKTGFASTQEAYECSLFPLFEGLDRLEAHLADPSHQPYLFGKNITDADIRLYSTLIRFDVAYFTSFRCNLKMIRYEYPRLHCWLRNLYWDPSGITHGAFRDTVRFESYKQQYAYASVSKITPRGPIPHILPL